MANDKDKDATIGTLPDGALDRHQAEQFRGQVKEATERAASVQLAMDAMRLEHEKSIDFERASHEAWKQEVAASTTKAAKDLENEQRNLTIAEAKIRQAEKTLAEVVPTLDQLKKERVAYAMELADRHTLVAALTQRAKDAETAAREATTRAAAADARALAAEKERDSFATHPDVIAARKAKEIADLDAKIKAGEAAKLAREKMA